MKKLFLCLAAALVWGAVWAQEINVADNGDVSQSVFQAVKPLRDKTFYLGPKAQFGYAAISSSSDSGPFFTGMLVSAGVFGEWLPNRYGTSGCGLAASYARYLFDEEFDLSHLDLDLYYVYRPRSQFAMKYGVRVGVPVSAKVGKMDVLEACKTPVGVFADFLWATRRTDLGGGLFYSFTDALDSGGQSSKILGISIQFAYRF